MKDKSLLLVLAGGAVLWWYLNQQQQPAATATPAPQPPAPQPPAPGTQPTTPPVVQTTPAQPVTVSYTGPTLAQMHDALLAAVANAYGSDNAITCGDGLSGLGQARGSGPITQPIATPSSGRTGYVTDPIIRTTLPYVAGPRGSTGCQNYVATSDVFNWYLVNRAVAGMAPAPVIPGDTHQPMTFAAYWAAMAPLLQAQTPGLSGYRRTPISLYGGWA